MAEGVVCDRSFAIETKPRWECRETPANCVMQVELEAGKGKGFTKVVHPMTDRQQVFWRDGARRRWWVWRGAWRERGLFAMVAKAT